jgi:hypothetical protein
LRALLHRGCRHQEGIAQCVNQQFDIDELVGEQRIVTVRKDRF